MGHILTLLLALSLVFSFGLHSIQVAHAHFGVESDRDHDRDARGLQLNEYMHFADKKVFAVALFVFLAPWASLTSSILTRLRLSLYFERRLVSRIRTLTLMWNIYFEYFKILYQRGILNTKVF